MNNRRRIREPSGMLKSRREGPGIEDAVLRRPAVLTRTITEGPEMGTWPISAHHAPWTSITEPTLPFPWSY